RGFAWYLFDNDLDPGNGFGGGTSQSVALPTTLTASGSEPASDVAVALHAAGDGWNLLGNPFLVGLNVSTVNSWLSGGATLASAVGQVWQCAPNSANPPACVGSYVTTDTAPLNGVVPAWHAVWFQASAPGTLTIPTAARAPSRRQPLRRLSFELAAGDGSALDRAATLVFREEATGAWDLWDLEKLASLNAPSVRVAFGGERDGERVLKAQGSYASDPGTLDIPIHVASQGAGADLVLSWPTLDDLPASWDLLLTDEQTGATIDLRSEPLYAFSVAEQPARQRGSPGTSARHAGDEARFTLSIRAGASTSEEGGGLAETWLGVPAPNPSSGTAVVRYSLASGGPARLTVVDLLGREVAVLADGALPAGEARAEIAASQLAPGVYVIRLEATGEVHTQRAVVVR
ncbi:MAG: T9SS type A sorting domain-containing protein, partial [Bacteroidota bacterium]